MKIYKAGTRYFSTYREAKTYREKYFSSARWIETIDVESGTINTAEDIVVRASWFKSDYSGGLSVRSYWCVGSISEFFKAKTDSQINVVTISRPQKDITYVDAFMTFRNMCAARYRIHSSRLISFLESEIEKVPVCSEVQIKI
jgi:hypothetical protein